MKKTLVSLLLALGVAAAQAGPITLINGSLYTNNNVTVGNSLTNSSGIYTNNFQIGVVLGTSNVLFNLGANGSQANTNLWPAVSFTPGGGNGSGQGYPNTLYGPYSATEFYLSFNLVATNTTATTLTTIWAGSVDGINWSTNWLTLTQIIGVNSTGTNAVLTNIVTGGLPWVSLQEIENPGTQAVTNMLFEVNGKPGL